MNFRLIFFNATLAALLWPGISSAVETNTVREVATAILNAKNPERDALISAESNRSAALIGELSKQMKVGTPDEYRVIPSIWKVAIDAGKRNEGEELLKILDVTLPQKAEPLRDWQAVVIGGGIINGLTLSGVWPKQRIETLLRTNDVLRTRWFYSIYLASGMADDSKVRSGTRYDALRMLGVAPWKVSGEQLTKYLGKEVGGELQQGAVCGVADIDAAPAADTLIQYFDQFTEKNRQFALDALLRNEVRAKKLVDALGAGKIPSAELGSTREEKLSAWPNEKVRQQFLKVKNSRGTQSK
jgi:hypothetical protein